MTFKIGLLAIGLLVNNLSVMGVENTKTNNQDHCYALVLGGGGTRGAY